jgi:hypothetical protein|uniref:Uncharacterized protein n=1 Tax=Thermodesulfovibrio aggregans TaxID=86166 RepID=A0A7C4ELK8_9BACT
MKDLKQALINAVEKFFNKRWIKHFPSIDSSFNEKSLLETSKDVDAIIIMLLDVESEEEVVEVLKQSSSQELAHLKARIDWSLNFLKAHKQALEVTIDQLYNSAFLQNFLKTLLIDAFYTSFK